jgi:type IV pilus assembly protein PilA
MSKKLLRDESGFTLIELMVVVAIIGVLSAIAVPNFKKYQAKAKQSEAKIQLAAVYTIEVGAMADYDSYASCILDLGYDRPARGYYVVGFGNHDPGNVVIRGGTCTDAGRGVIPTTPLLAGRSSIYDITEDGWDAAEINGQEFTAYAGGNIQGQEINWWHMTQAKQLTEQ